MGWWHNPTFHTPTLTPHRDTGLGNKPVPLVHVPVVSCIHALVAYLPSRQEARGSLGDSNSTSMHMKISAAFNTVITLSHNHKSKGNWAPVFFLSKMAECQWLETHLLGHFPPCSDGFIFKCYVNVITNTGKVLSRSLHHHLQSNMTDEAICIGGSRAMTRTPDKFSKLPETVFWWAKSSFISPSLFL